MNQIGNIPEIIEIKKHLETLKEQKLISDWELPYENLLTRLTAAIFYFALGEGIRLSQIKDQMVVFGDAILEENKETLSILPYSLIFR